MPNFEKPALSAEALVEILKSKNLIIHDEDKAKYYIEHIGYYRLYSYFFPFYDENNHFKDNVYFSNILNLYNFDKKLRLFMFDPIQQIEISIRAAISDYMAIKYDPFWFTNKNLFLSDIEYNNFINIAQKHAGRNSYGISVACKHYFEKYSDGEFPPSWILSESLPMGCWSKLFTNISDKQDKRHIAEKFDFKWNDFSSWIHTITILRNAIAHHIRFWNMNFPIRPSNIKNYAKDAGFIIGAYQNYVIVLAFLKRIDSKTSWSQKLQNMLDNCPLSIHQYMNFPVDWKTMTFWLN